MMTEAIETQEEVHDAIVVVPNTPITFDITTAAIAQMQAKAASLTITGPDDKVGFAAVYECRQMVKRQRIAVQNKQKALKRPHIDYNRDVDAAADLLIEPMAAIEDKLAHQEKAYNDEKESIAHEKLLAQQQRTEGRINQLRQYGFVWNGAAETYDFIREEYALHLRINFDDIKEFSDEEYEPTAERAGWIYGSEQQFLAQKREAERIEAERLAAEQKAENDRIAAENKRLTEQAADLQRKSDELDALTLKNRITALLNVGYTERNRMYHSPSGLTFIKPKSLLLLTDAQFLSLIDETVRGNQVREVARITQEAVEAKRIADEKQAAADKIKADKLRTARLKPDKKVLKTYLNHYTGPGLMVKLTEEETNEIYIRFLEKVTECVADSLNEVDAL